MIYNKYDKHPKPMQITDEEQAAFDNARHCHICDKLLISREKSENDMIMQDLKQLAGILSQITAISQISTEVQLIVYAIYKIKYQTFIPS
jgi:hypothetical protein